MLFRAVVTTAFFALAIETNVAVDPFEGRNLLYLGMIAGSYLLTLLWALMLRAGRPRGLASTQLALDVVFSVVLVASTGGLRQSLFTFTLFLPVVAAALVTTRRVAMVFAAVVSGILVVLCVAALGVGSLQPPWLPQVDDARRGSLILEAGLNICFAFMLAWGAGQLNRQLQGATGVANQRGIALRSLQVEHQQILQSLNSGLITVDDQGIVVFINRTGCAIVELEESDIVGHKLELVFPHAAQLASEDPTSTSPLQERRLEALYTTPQGQPRHLGFSVSLMSDREGIKVGRILIFQDLTEIKALERQAKQSEHLAAIGQLAAAIAHEVRNPLAAISGSVEMLRDLGSLGEDEAALMGIVLREVDRLNDLITRFLAYSRPPALALVRGELAPIIEEVAQLFGHGLDQQPVTLELELKPCPQVMFDPEAVRQVMWNLLNNALEAMREDPGQQTAQKILVTLEPTQGGGAAIAVEDQGPGVPQELRERVFEPFFTTKAQGTGLGLATMYRIAAAHGGTLTLEAPKQLGGARFVLTLPPNSSSTASQELS